LGAGYLAVLPRDFDPFFAFFVLPRPAFLALFLAAFFFAMTVDPL
jgi:hypothetical protein